MLKNITLGVAVATTLIFAVLYFATNHENQINAKLMADNYICSEAMTNDKYQPDEDLQAMCHISMQKFYEKAYTLADVIYSD
jgi:hypothetical protein